jgi:hypothetical protein
MYSSVVIDKMTLASRIQLTDINIFFKKSQASVLFIVLEEQSLFFYPGGSTI